MLKIALCDDDTRQLENTNDFINILIRDNRLDAEIVFNASSYEQMDEYLISNEADLYIMDIDLGEDDYKKTGYKLAQKIRSKSKVAYILFVTGRTEYVFDAYDIKAYNYLRKPMSYNKFEGVFFEIYNEFNSKQANTECYINVQSGSVTHRIKQCDIVYIEKIGQSKIKIKLIDGLSIESNMTLSDIQEKCDNKVLIRTYISFLCNVNLIKSVDYKTNEIVMTNGDKCLLGRTYKDEFKYAYERKMDNKGKL